jgi:hypothetical protein
LGQTIEVIGTKVVGDVAMFDTDRSITGQSGKTFESGEEAVASESFPGMLAGRLFERLAGLAHVFVASNLVVVGRSGSWDEGALDEARRIITDFFVFYPDQGSSSGGA